MDEHIPGESMILGEDYFEGLSETEFTDLVGQIKLDHQVLTYYNLIKEKLQRQKQEQGGGHFGVSRTEVVAELISALKAGGGSHGVVSEELYQKIQAMIASIKEKREAAN